MDTLQRYIREFNFESYLENMEKKLTGNSYQDFTLEFWENPSTDITKLKSKYKIQNSTSIMSILMQNPIEEYCNLLEDVWKRDKGLDELIQIHKMKISRIEQLLFPLIYTSKEDFCPHCYEGSEFEVSIKLRQGNIMVRCLKCDKKVENFISKEKRDENILKKKETDKVFNELVEGIRKQLKDIKCDKCQSILEVVTNEGNNYSIVCSSCKNSYADIDEAEELYKRWKQRAVMMLKIKAREDETLTKALESKAISDIRIKSEPIITKIEAIKVIKELVTFQMNEEDTFKELFKRYRQMNRVDRRVLIFICKECLHKGTKATWGSERSNTKLQMDEITYCEPIISELSDKTKIEFIRPIIRRLLDNSLIYCDEELNIINVHPALTQNVQYLEAFNKPQTISNDISNLVFMRQNYICYHCSETGRPLKIAYLTGEKNNNDLSSLVGVCDTCFYEVTENEILFDTAIIAVDQVNNDLGKAYNFICYWDKELRESELAVLENEALISQYEENEVIKAYAGTLYKKHTKGLANDRAFFSYARSILENSIQGVNIYKNIEDKYEVRKWL